MKTEKQLYVEGKPMEWRIHTPNLLKEIADAAIPRNAGILFVPLNQFRILLSQVATRASELNDPALNKLMVRLTLYEVADPESKEYDSKAVEKVLHGKHYTGADAVIPQHKDIERLLYMWRRYAGRRTPTGKTFSDADINALEIRDIHKRVCEFFTAGDDFTDPLGDDEDCKNFEIVPVALTMEQILKYRPPPNPAKITDPRAKWYIQQVGKKSWELDALKPEVLMRIAEEAVQQFLDVDAYNAVIKKEQKAVKALKDFGKKMAA